MTKKIRNLLILFVVLSVVGIGYIAFRYVGADSLIGLGPYTVKVEMRDSGGIFPKASVSYRGVEIGKVGDMRITPGGLEVDLEIENEAPEVPASAVAVIANRSAVGEQYVDLQPPRDGGPYLEDGSVIPVDRVRTPTQIDGLLANLNTLATSVPIPELRTTVDELYTAFDRTGPDLQRLLDSSNALVSTAIQQLPQTTQLLRDGRVVLGTQASLGPQIVSFSRDLNLFTAQLKADDPNLRRLVRAAPPAAQQLEGLIRETGPDLSRVLANLLTTVRIIQPRLPGVEQLLVTYPGLSAVAPAVVPGDGRVHFGLVLNIADPPYCRDGYLQPNAGWRPATDQSFIPMDTRVYCAQGGVVNPRGAQHTPELDGGKRPYGEILNPNEYYYDPANPPPGTYPNITPVPATPYTPGQRPAPAPGQNQNGNPGSSASQASSQNADQTTAFSAASSSPADVLANSGRGAPPVVIPGLG
ncbi:MlaD family protein [Actinomycetospora corticicola]|uniref:Phospholipid/cholesterol/gamma-HCH transport system substrate-binding protein n=1 Tax=Actinomycetospora corticicola TaxID=663602 RepID=A0A7Y9J6U1_9PSEU|nr:MCE family protein [Actinomycetospora corticicola]NYD37747.1 phospholipid/cholesterol/gamma-HCH transport system substrate-binding protein [Actinomycetospora corticicola]